MHLLVATFQNIPSLKLLPQLNPVSALGSGTVSWNLDDQVLDSRAGFSRKPIYRSHHNFP